MIGRIPVLAPASDAGRGRGDSLREAAEQAGRRLRRAPAVTLVVNDPQRATRTDLVLEQLRPWLAGKRLRALVATGTHRYDEAARRRFERSALSGLPLEAIAWHDCDSPELVDLTGEVPWQCHPWLAGHGGPVLAIGSCEPHYFAGITGAHKTVTIGCADAEAVRANHFHALSADARPCRLAGNPVHEGIAAMLASLPGGREVIALNLLQVGEAIVSARCGRPLEALESIAPLVRRTYVRRIEAPADALVLNVDGVPGRCFYQADKGIKNNEWAVRDGGALVLRARCPDRIGQDHFMRLLRDCPSCESAEAALGRNGYRLGDHKAVKLRRLTGRRRVRLFAVSDGLTDDDLRVLGFARAQSAAAALAAAGIDPYAAKVYRVADAANTCVEVGP